MGFKATTAISVRGGQRKRTAFNPQPRKRKTARAMDADAVA
jgi:hypothetical protein